jgi:RNA polymerase sigma-70 factor (ECF subfamily)
MSIMLSSVSDALVCAAIESDEPPREPRASRMTQAGSSPPPDDREATDARLLRRVAGRDKQAFTELYDRFSSPLYGTAIRIVRDTAEAQDIVHDAFVTVWEKAGSFEVARGTAYAWVVTLVRNRAIDRVRMRRRRSELLETSAPSDFGYTEAGAGATVEDAAALGDEARAVRAAVATLPADQQRALELAFFGGLTQEEIATKLATPLGTVKARIRRGLLKLRETVARRL